MKITYLNNQDSSKNANNFNNQSNYHKNVNNFYEEKDKNYINSKNINNNSTPYDYNQYKSDNNPQSMSKKFNVTPSDVYNVRENREETRGIKGDYNTINKGKNNYKRNGNFDFIID